MSARSVCNVVYSFLDEDQREELAETDPQIRNERRRALVLAMGGEIG